MAKSTAIPIVAERRHTVSIWLLLLGVLAFIVGCVLLFMEDGSSSLRTTPPPLKPRSEAPARNGVAAINPSVPPIATASAGNASTFPADFLDGLWHEADAAGISRTTFDRAFTAARGPDNEVVALNASQPEFERTVGDYVTVVATADRAAAGQSRLSLYGQLLAELERRYGVDRNILLALWGIESNYGAAKGDRSVIRSLATLANAEPRRAATWRAELIAALTILEQERIPPEKLTGSWAGAMGHTQLMPTAFLKNAVNFDGTGRRDVWGSVPDALASAARFLQAAGWVQGRLWSREVVVPADFDYAVAVKSAARSTAAWGILGVRAQSGTLAANDTAAWQLIVPAGAGGPAFLVSQNFDALLAYNPAYAYAMAVGVLADRIAGNAAIQAAWPASDRPMSRDQRIELQEILNSQGFDAGVVDGIVGIKTRDAVRGYQKAHSLPADGHPSVDLLSRLRSGRRL